MDKLELRMENRRKFNENVLNANFVEHIFLNDIKEDISELVKVLDEIGIAITEEEILTSDWELIGVSTDADDKTNLVSMIRIADIGSKTACIAVKDLNDDAKISIRTVGDSKFPVTVGKTKIVKHCDILISNRYGCGLHMGYELESCNDRFTINRLREGVYLTKETCLDLGINYVRIVNGVK